VTRHPGHEALVDKAVGAADTTPEVNLWADALEALKGYPKLDKWVRVVLLNWILNRVHLLHPGVAPWNSENWHIETDPAKLQERKSLPADLISESARVAKVKNIGRFSACLALELDREWRHHWSSETRSSQKARKDNNAHSLQQLKKLARLSSDLSDLLRTISGYAEAELSLALDEKTSDGNEESFPSSQADVLTMEKTSDRNDESSPASQMDMLTMEILMKHTDCVRVPFVEERDRAIEAYTSAIKLFAGVAAAAAAHAESMVIDEPMRRSRGRPDTGGGWSVVGAGNLKAFTLRILWDVRAAGGHLTLNKNNDEVSGTLIKLLERLRPYLPSGLIPAKVLPLSTLSRVKVLDQKIAAAAKSTGII
jgi:hypothetical protein